MDSKSQREHLGKRVYCREHWLWLVQKVALWTRCLLAAPFVCVRPHIAVQGSLNDPFMKLHVAGFGRAVRRRMCVFACICIVSCKVWRTAWCSKWCGVNWRDLCEVILFLKLSEVKWVTVKFLGIKVPCTLGWPYTEGTWLHCDYFIWVYLVLWLF
jgi:hypothetical protein